MIDTAGNKQESISSCQCGLTGGCLLCNPSLNSINYARLFDPCYGHEEFQKGMDERAKKAVPREKFKEIREKTKEIVDWKRFLTEEVLHEIWHESDGTYLGQKCICGRECGWPRETLDEHIKGKNHTFNNPSDMMELYRYMYEDDCWIEFENWIYERILLSHYCKEKISTNNFTAWLFCLGSEDYEGRCKMVAEFYSYKEEKMVLERLKGRKQPEDHPDVDLMHENDNVLEDCGVVIKIAGLEKIEPLTTGNIGYSISGVDHVTGVSPSSSHELMRVINKIIEQQNRIVDYLNQEIQEINVIHMKNVDELEEEK